MLSIFAREGLSVTCWLLLLLPLGWWEEVGGWEEWEEVGGWEEWEWGQVGGSVMLPRFLSMLPPRLDRRSAMLRPLSTRDLAT